jgi:pyridoxine/pyridoxamine 5'-phosphate oxidase
MKVTSMRGRVVDMASLTAKNENMRALGNAGMNARGDVIGANGKIVKTREEIAREYYQSSPHAVKNVALKDIQSEVFQSPQEAVEAIEKATKEAKHPRRKIEDSDD